MSQPSLREQSIHGGAWSAIGALGVSAIGLVSFVFMSRLLGPEVYGLMAMVEVSLAVGQKWMASGLSEPLIQIRQLKPEHSDTLFWTLQGLGIGMTGILMLASPAIGAYFHQTQLPQLVSAAAVILYIQATSLVPESLLAREFRFSAIARADAGGELAGAAVGITLALNGFGVWSLVGQRMAAAIANSIILASQARWMPHFRWTSSAFSQIWRFSLSRGAEGMFSFADQQVPRILLGRFAGPADLGYFVFARRIVENTTSLLNSPLKTTALSAFATVQDDVTRLRRIYREGTSITTAVVFPACAGLILIAPYLVPVLAGPMWIPSVALFQMLVIASLRQSFHMWNAALLRGVGKPQWLLAVSATRTVVVLGLIAILLDWGPLGACIAILTGNFLSWPVATLLVRRATQLGVAEQLQPGAQPLAAAGFMAAVLWLLRPGIALRFSAEATVAVLVVAGVLIYVAALSLLGPDRVRQLVHIFRTLRKIRA